MIEDLLIEHSYYCEECNYYKNDTTEKYDTWQDFLEEYGDADLDMNMIFRWDIILDEDTNKYIMKLFFMQQRRGKYYCCIINDVTNEDENSIRTFLSKYWEYMKELWKPISNNK